MLKQVFDTMEAWRIPYCILRDGDRLHELSSGGEVDLLVDKSQLAAFRNIMQQLGFVELPAWGHQPHHFFVGYLKQSHGWLKLDVITRVAYGRPSHALHTTLAAGCLARRQRRNQTYVPSTEYELVMLLMHCVLDKKEFSQKHRDRLGELCRQVSDPAFAESLFAQYWATNMSWARVTRLVNEETWSELMRVATAVEARLRSRVPMLTPARVIRDRALRKLDRWTRAYRFPGLSVAILAPDGAGKSTLVQAIEKSFVFSTYRIYMGLYKKNDARPRTSANVRLRIPGLGLAVMLLRQWARYARARLQRARGRLVLFDRYTYDALLPAPLRRGRLSQFRRLMLARACPGPDLVVMLDAPGSVLFSRKGEHSPAKLERQRQSYLAMRSCLRQMVVVDATSDSDTVCRDVTSVIWHYFLRRYYRVKVAP